MSDPPPHTLVLGAGPCGLYAALTLLEAGHKVTVLEKEARPGGLATSHKRGNNWYDLGVHMLHEYDREVFEKVQGVMGNERIEVQLDAKIKWAGSFYRYPLQFQDMVKGIPPLTLARCTLGLFFAQFRERIAPWEPLDAEEALRQLYGNSLYEFFFKDFTHRYWGIPPQQLSATFIKSKMPRLSAVDVMKRALSKVGIKEKEGRAVESALLDETLHYSRTGAETMTRRLGAHIRKIGGDLHLESPVKQLHQDGNRIVAVTCKDGPDGAEKRIDCDFCISTIPMPDMAKSMTPEPSRDVLKACGHLRYKPIAVYGLLVNKPKAIDGLYIYYRDRIFHRVGEPKNAGLIVNPPDHTVLIVEMTCELGDPKWKGDESVKEQIFADLEVEEICTKDDVVEVNLLTTPHGYPVFSLGFEPYLETLTGFIDSIDNLTSTGRNGGFCYPNMHSAMRMGADAADKVIERSAAS